LPGYFVLLSIWRLIDPGIFFSKLFSIISVGIAAIYIYKLSNLFLNKKSSRWIIVIFLLNPFTVWAALEIRLYAFSIMLSCLCIYFFYVYVFQSKKKYLYFFLLASLFGVYTQYFFVFLISTLVFTTIFVKGWKYFFTLCLYLLPVALLFLPNFMFIPNQLQMQTGYGGNHRNLNKVRYVLYTPQAFMLAIDYIPVVWQNRIIRLIFLVLFIYTCFRLYMYHFPENKRFHLNFKILVISVISLEFLLSLSVYLTNIVYTVKYLVVAFPFFILLFVVFNLYSRVYKVLIYGSISLYFSIILVSFYRHPVNTYDFISMAKYVQKIEKPTTTILLYRSNLNLPFKYYYKGKNPVVPWPQPVNFNSNYLTNIKDTNQLKQLFNNSPSKSYILVSDTTTFETTLKMNRDMVKDYIYDHYNVKIDTFFKGWAKEKTFHIYFFEQK
jgi:hypothetical protein